MGSQREAARRQPIQRSSQSSRAGETFSLRLMKNHAQRGTQLDPVEIAIRQEKTNTYRSQIRGFDILALVEQATSCSGTS